MDFVGTQRRGTFADPDHEGHPGDTIDEIADNAYCPVRHYRPNVVTLHAGTNDMNEALDLEDAPGRLGSLIDQILRNAPDATVLVATLVPSYKTGLQPRIDAYNAQLPAIVERRREQGGQVRLVDMGEVTADDLVEPSHPGDSGYVKMADAFHGALAQAEAEGWIDDPVPADSTAPCDVADNEPVSGVGPGWRSLGVIASGMQSPAGRTDLVELNGDNRASAASRAKPSASPTLTATAATICCGSAPTVPSTRTSTPVRAGRSTSTGLPASMAAPGTTCASPTSTATARPTTSWSSRAARSTLTSTTGTGATPTPPGRRFTEVRNFVNATHYPADKSTFRDIGSDGRADYVVIYDGGAIRCWLNRGGNTGQ
ncbi:GDSL-type esterase/lipase family protein [Streptomyces sp. S.PNR 29]|nr:GDSL-type esterase/lipase family protein [Streptomyces sp. S.PNR 29]MDN0200771.1 GDSL-type esterase/lipase family protein [Streptomyces sp. S.PNR 29]